LTTAEPTHPVAPVTNTCMSNVSGFHSRHVSLLGYGSKVWTMSLTH
jgi:hypothetical protein